MSSISRHVCFVAKVPSSPLLTIILLNESVVVGVCYLHLTWIDHVLVNWVTMMAYNSRSNGSISMQLGFFFVVSVLIWIHINHPIQNQTISYFCEQNCWFSSSTKSAPNKLTSIASMEKLAWWPKVFWLSGQAWWLSAKGDTGLDATCWVLFDYVL